MARINWEEKIVEIFLNLKINSVADTAKQISVSYASLCKFIKDHQINKKGVLEKKIDLTDEIYDILDASFKWSSNPDELSSLLGISKRRLVNYANHFGFKPKWDLQNSTSLQVRVGRKAEVFVASLPDFKVLKDTAKYHTNAPHDLILSGYGGVDVKSTKLRKTDYGGSRWKFNVASNLKKTARQVKYYFLVGYDEDYEKELVLFILPASEVKGKSSISISCDKLDSCYYKQFLFRSW